MSHNKVRQIYLAHFTHCTGRVFNTPLAKASKLSLVARQLSEQSRRALEYESPAESVELFESYGHCQMLTKLVLEVP